MKSAQIEKPNLESNGKCLPGFQWSSNLDNLELYACSNTLLTQNCTGTFLL